MSTRTRTPVDLDLDSDMAREAYKRAVRDWNYLTPEQRAGADFDRIVARHRAAIEHQAAAWESWRDLGGEG